MNPESCCAIRKIIFYHLFPCICLVYLFCLCQLWKIRSFWSERCYWCVNKARALVRLSSCTSKLMLAKTYENTRHYYPSILVLEKCAVERLDVDYFCSITLLFVQHSMISATLLQVGVISWQADSTSFRLPPPLLCFQVLETVQVACTTPCQLWLKLGGESCD